MAKRIVPQEEIPTLLILNKSALKKTLEERIQAGEVILTADIQYSNQLAQYEKEFSNWNDYNSELLKQAFNIPENEYKYRYDSINGMYGIYQGRGKDILTQFKERVENKIDGLRQLLAKVDLLKSSQAESVEIKKNPITTTDHIFIVHGHSELKSEVARTIELLGLKPIILQEQPNAGKTIIEKFEEYANVGYAVILLTNDDEGRAKSETSFKDRARQNVILELGYFFGKLGRNKFCALYNNGVELPSDIHGFLFHEVDSAGYWKVKLAKEFKAAGYNVDLNNL